MRIGVQPLVLSVALATVGFAQADPTARAYDINRPAWHDGEIVQVFARVPLPGSGLSASPERPDEKVYLIGNAFDLTPFSADLPLPNQAGVAPAHDDVLISRSTQDAPVDGFGRWVIAGKRAVTDSQRGDWNVRLREMPARSIVGQPLAYAVRLDDQWLMLTDARVIERALAAELIATIDKGVEGFGGIGWTQPARKERLE